jgi:hypothetical protein
MSISRRCSFFRLVVVFSTFASIAFAQSQATTPEPSRFETYSDDALHRLDYFVSIDYVGRFLAGGACDCAGRLLVEFDSIAHDPNTRRFFVSGSVADLATDEPLEYPDVFLAPFDLPDSGFVFYSPTLEGGSDSLGAFTISGVAETDACLYVGVPTYKLTIFALHKLFAEREGAP